MSSYSARNATLPLARAIDLIPDHLAQAGDIETQAAKSHEIWSREQGARRHRMIQILRRRIARESDVMRLTDEERRRYADLRPLLEHRSGRIVARARERQRHVRGETGDDGDHGQHYLSLIHI